MNNFYSLENIIKSNNLSAVNLATQSYVYAGITAYFSQSNKFNDLGFTNNNSSIIIRDYNRNNTLKDNIFKYYGLITEGHPEYWFPINESNNKVLISGHEHCKIYNNNIVSIGFDYWDLKILKEYSNPALILEVNRKSINDAIYDVLLPVGAMRPHRIEFLKLLNDRKGDLKIVTDDAQNIIETDLRFSKLGYESYFNKFNIDKYALYSGYHSFYSSEGYKSLNHLPHKDMHSASRVCVALETTAFNTQQAYITEKTYKILAHARPFIILGDTNILIKLKNAGFKTFGDFCDESYDTEPNLTKKMEIIIEAINQLTKACLDYPTEIDAICQHNQQHFYNPIRCANNLANFGKLCLTHIYMDTTNA